MLQPLARDRGLPRVRHHRGLSPVPGVRRAPAVLGTRRKGPGPGSLMAKNIYVGNLPWQTTQDDLYQLFSQYGQVSKAQVISDRETGRSRGFGFVEMPDDAEAQKAIEALNESQFNGRPLTVNEAKPREPRAGGGGGYGGGGGGYGGGRGGRGGYAGGGGGRGGYGGGGGGGYGDGGGGGYGGGGYGGGGDQY